MAKPQKWDESLKCRFKGHLENYKAELEAFREFHEEIARRYGITTEASALIAYLTKRGAL
jgi:hypothetical protein